MSWPTGKRAAVKVPCAECKVPISKSNILRHWRLHASDEFGEQSSQAIQGPPPSQGPPPTQQQRSAPANLSLDELVVGNKMSATPSVSSSIISTTAETIRYTVAARALLKRTESYTEEGLTAFLAARYPEVEEEHRHSLIIGAVTVTQTAAQLYVLLDGARSGSDKGSQVTSEGARPMLSFYNLGLISEDPYDPNRQIRLSPKLPVPSVCQEPQEEEEPEVFEVSASQEDTRHREERQQVDEGGEDTETSSRAIEMVELEIPGTQPCNRQDPVTRKRARSSSPGHSTYQAELWRRYLYHPTLDDSIQLQIEMEARAERQERGGSNSQEIPPSPPPTKGRKMELPLLLREPPLRGAPPPHIPATVTSAAVAAQRQTRPTSPRVKSFVPSFSGTSSKAAAAKGGCPRQTSPKHQQSTSRQPPPRRQSPARGTSGHRRSISPRGHHQTSRSLSPDNRGKLKDRREHDCGNCDEFINSSGNCVTYCNHSLGSLMGASSSFLWLLLLLLFS